MRAIGIQPLILLLLFPIQVHSQAISIPVIPYYKVNSSVPVRVHNKCKSIVNYTNCVKRYLRIY